MSSMASGDFGLSEGGRRCANGGRRRWAWRGCSGSFGAVLEARRMGWGPCIEGMSAPSDGVGDTEDRTVDPYVVARVRHVVAFAHQHLGG